MANHQRTPLSRTLPLLAQRAALEEIEQRGYALPCHVTAVNGAIVTVAFDCTTSGAALPPCQMAITGSEYVRIPIQKGCKGTARPNSVDINIVTGLGPGSSLPDLSVLPANLSALVFEPCGNSAWPASPNADATVIYGAGAGVILQDIAAHRQTPQLRSIPAESRSRWAARPGHSLPQDSPGARVSWLRRMSTDLARMWLDLRP